MRVVQTAAPIVQSPPRAQKTRTNTTGDGRRLNNWVCPHHGGRPQQNPPSALPQKKPCVLPKSAFRAPRWLGTNLEAPPTSSAALPARSLALPAGGGRLRRPARRPRRSARKLRACQLGGSVSPVGGSASRVVDLRAPPAWRLLRPAGSAAPPAVGRRLHRKYRQLFPPARWSTDDCRPTGPDNITGGGRLRHAGSTALPPPASSNAPHTPARRPCSVAGRGGSAGRLDGPVRRRRSGCFRRGGWPVYAKEAIPAFLMLLLLPTNTRRPAQKAGACGQGWRRERCWGGSRPAP